MSVIREFNWLGQARVDVPHLRTLDSSNAADFDILAGVALAGQNALVVTGFQLLTVNAIGQPATALQLQVDPGLIFHYNASENGTIFRTQSGTPAQQLTSTNPNVQGSFTASQVNYVGLDLSRSTDPSTSDLVEFLDADTLLEEPETVPLARTLNFVIIISTSDFTSTPNVLPLALVTTDAHSNVLTIQDARNMLGRLGTGGTTPNIYNAYTWPQGRNELSNGNLFQGGDKAFNSLRDILQGMETRIHEIGGGGFWYSATSDRQAKFCRSLNARFPNGDNFTIYPLTNIAAGSNGVNLNTTPGTIYVTSTAGFPTSGTIYVFTSGGTQTVTYTGITGTTFTGTAGGTGVMLTGGEVTSGTDTNNILWQGLSIVFCNSGTSGVYENVIADQTVPLAGLTDLQPGQCIYVDVDENAQILAGPSALQPVKANMATLGQPPPPYTRWVIAWATAGSPLPNYFTLDSQWGVGTLLGPAGPYTSGGNGEVELNIASNQPANPVVTVFNTSTLATVTPALSRGAGGGAAGVADFGVGILAIGTGASDTTIQVGSASVTSQQIFVGFGSNGGTTTIGGSTIYVGPNNNSFVDIGSTGTTTNIAGVSLSSSTTSAQILTTTGTLTLDSGSGAIVIGTSTASSITIGRLGASTTIIGNSVQIETQQNGGIIGIGNEAYTDTITIGALGLGTSVTVNAGSGGITLASPTIGIGTTGVTTSLSVNSLVIRVGNASGGASGGNVQIGDITTGAGNGGTVSIAQVLGGGNGSTVSIGTTTSSGVGANITVGQTVTGAGGTLYLGQSGGGTGWGVNIGTGGTGAAIIVGDSASITAVGGALTVAGTTTLTGNATLDGNVTLVGTVLKVNNVPTDGLYGVNTTIGARYSAFGGAATATIFNNLGVTPLLPSRTWLYRIEVVVTNNHTGVENVNTPTITVNWWDPNLSPVVGILSNPNNTAATKAFDGLNGQTTWSFGIVVYAQVGGGRGITVTVNMAGDTTVMTAYGNITAL